MDEKNECEEMCKVNVHNIPSELTSSPEDNKLNFELPDSFCKITWSQIFEETLTRYADSIPMDIKAVYNPSTSGNHPKMCENLIALHKQIQFQFQILVDQYKLVQAEHAKTLETKENLFTVNNKILDRLRVITAKNKQSVRHKEVQVQDTPEANKKIITGMQDNSTQTQTGEAALDQSDTSFNSPEIKDISKLTRGSYRKDKQKKRDSSDLEMTKIISYRVSEEIGIADIINAINVTIQCPIDSITFIRKYTLRETHAHNYVFEIPRNIAISLIMCKYICIRTRSFPVKQFVRVIRCFRCHEYNHFEDSCNKTKICARCGNPHDSLNCVRTPRCINCVKNNKFNRNFRPDHPASSKECPSLKNYIKQQRNLLKT